MAGINPYGAVWVNDFGNPKVISGRVKSTAISGGQLVTVSGLVNVVSSGADSFTVDDILFIPGASGANFVVVALATLSSGTNTVLPLAVEAVFILTARVDGTSGGFLISAAGDDCVAVSANGLHNIGRSLTNADSGGFAVAYIK